MSLKTHPQLDVKGLSLCAFLAMWFLGFDFFSRASASFFLDNGVNSQLAQASQPLKFFKPQLDENYLIRVQDNSRETVQTNQKSDPILLILPADHKIEDIFFS